MLSYVLSIKLWQILNPILCVIPFISSCCKDTGTCGWGLGNVRPHAYLPPFPKECSFITLFPLTLGENWFHQILSAAREYMWGRQLQHNLIWKHWKETLLFCCWGGAKALSLTFLKVFFKYKLKRIGMVSWNTLTWLARYQCYETLKLDLLGWIVYLRSRAINILVGSFSLYHSQIISTF